MLKKIEVVLFISIIILVFCIGFSGCVGRQAYTTQYWDDGAKKWCPEKRIIATHIGTSGLHTKTNELEMKKTDSVGDVMNFVGESLSTGVAAVTANKNVIS